MRALAIIFLVAAAGAQERNITLDIRSSETTPDGKRAEVFVRATEDGKPLGFGADGSVETERIVVINPPTRVPDGTTRLVTYFEGTPRERTIEVANFRDDPEAALTKVVGDTVALVGKKDRAVQRGSVGRSTLVVYPESGEGGTTTDGRIDATGAGSSWNDLHDATTGSVNFTTVWAALACDNDFITPTYETLTRSVITFDTSALGASASISSATLSLYGQAKANGTGDPDADIVAATPAAHDTLAGGDFDGFGATVFSEIAYASFSTSAYNDFVVNGSGISHVSLTGVSDFGFRLSWDVDDTEPPSPAVGESSFYVQAAETGGTTQDPKLTIEYTVPAAGNPGAFFQLLTE